MTQFDAGKKISIAIVEDHEITRVGLKLTLEQVGGLQIVDVAADGASGIEAALLKRPNVVLMDIGLPDMDGIEAARKIKSVAGEIKIIMLTSHDNDRDIFAALAAGADGYCLKETPR